MKRVRTGHDPVEFGELKAARNVALRSVPDVILAVKQIHGLTHLEAVFDVLTRIRDSPGARCYITSPGGPAKPLHRPDVWPPESVPKAGHVPMVTEDLPSVLRGYWRFLRQLASRAAKERCGFSDDDLFVAVGPGQLAIHAADAQAVFAAEWKAMPVDVDDTARLGDAVPAHGLPSSQSTGTGQVLHLVDAKANQPAASVEIKATKKPGEPWDEHRSTLLKQFRHLVSPGGGGMKAYAADDHLAGVWSSSPSNIKQQRLKAQMLESRGRPIPDSSACG